MPWVDGEKCTGCGVCIIKCPVGAVSLEKERAKINMDSCIRCGICHSVCSEQAVRHDSEKIPDEVSANVVKTRSFMEECAKYSGEDSEKAKCLKRMKKYFNKEKIVAEKTLEELEKIK